MAAMLAHAGSAGGARKIVSEMRSLDTSGVEVDDEQIAPTIAANSPEEQALYEQLEEALKATGNKEVCAAPEATKLMCLRGRKYDVERAAALLPKHLMLRLKLLTLGPKEKAQLTEDLQTHKIVYTGGKDVDGRALIWIRLRYHDPSKSKPEDMARLLMIVLLEALKDPDVQRAGVAIINDLNGLTLKNVHPATVKFLFKEVFPAMPVRVGRICILNPPWIVAHVIAPVVLTFMSKKLRNRIVLLKEAGKACEQLRPYASEEQLAAEHGGSLAFDQDAWATQMVAAL